MLKRLLNFDRSSPTGAGPALRQASNGAGAHPRPPRSISDNVDAETVPIALAATPTLANSVSPRVDGQITDIAQVGEWRSLVPDVVRKSDFQSCVVLDMQLRNVLVLATADFYASSSHQALRHRLAAGNWQVLGEKTSAPEVIAAARQQAESRDIQAAGDQHNLQLYKDISAGAFNMTASDIHIRLNLRDAKSDVRIRIDGKLRDWKTFDTQVLEDALAAGYNALTFKGTNSAPAWTTERPISTITRFPHGTALLQGRLSTTPTAAGCKVVIRISDATPKDITAVKLQNLGFTDQQVDEFVMPALAREKGFIMISGSTGDGKTTTLEHMLTVLPDRNEKSLLGVEDPTEMDVPRMDHISLQTSADDSKEQRQLKFDAALLQALRMDPDVIMQGEVRDKISGQFASDIVMTGHLWLGTMHGNSALNSIFRLIGDKIQVDPAIVASMENFVMSMTQKLLPKLCSHCKKPAAEVMPPQELTAFRQKFHLGSSELFCANSEGCPHCKHGSDIESNGEKGRIGAIEIISKPTTEFLNCILARDERGAEVAWRRTRRAPFNHPDMMGKTCYEHGLYWVSQGIVSPLALQRVFSKHFSEISVFELTMSVKEVA
jgi:type II secretory ATPase GspE/PulE/Tfp pilus assembly ATPase PilB-like protein